MMPVQDDYLVFAAAGQKCALPALDVREVARRLPLTPVPGACTGIAGIVNLRGHVLTALDTAALLGLPQMSSCAANIIVAADGRFYSLLADAAGDMLRLPRESLHPLDAGAQMWRGAASRICRSPQGEIIPLLDIPRVLRGFSEAPKKESAVAREYVP